MRLEPLGDSAAVATLGSGGGGGMLGAVAGLAAAVRAAGATGIVDVVPAYDTVTVFYDPLRFEAGADAYASVCRLLQSCAARASAAPPAADHLVEIPVCYGGDFGPDLGAVAARGSLAPGEVVALHAGADYQVRAIGFLPGFPYLAGLPAALHTPRRETPRDRVPAGSVGIGGAQTGVYPLASPGGWRLIGRTPLALFRPADVPAALLRAGDRVRFRAITLSEFETWR